MLPASFHYAVLSCTVSTHHAHPRTVGRLHELRCMWTSGPRLSGIAGPCIIIFVAALVASTQKADHSFFF